MKHSVSAVVISPTVCVCVFLQAVYSASVPEDLPPHSPLLRVRATDADMGLNAWIQYSLHGPGSQDFIMEPDTGKERVCV